MFIASLYRSTAVFIFPTNLFHVSGAAWPSSKNERGTAEGCTTAVGALVKDVVEAIAFGRAVAGVMDIFGL